MEKIVVSDTNIFIDLISVNLLDGFFSLPWEIHTTDMIMKELKDSNQKAVVDAFRQLGNLKIKGFDGNEMLELMRMRKRASESSNASIQDCSVWKLAKNLNCSLLTGDNRLRKVVQKDNIEVHGILYLFDKMLEHQVINHETAITKLQSLFNINSRLPKDEIDKRIELWKAALTAQWKFSGDKHKSLQVDTEKTFHQRCPLVML